jgi:hypothetical protein
MEPKEAIAAMKKLSKEVGQHAAKAIDAPKLGRCFGEAI